MRPNKKTGGLVLETFGEQKLVCVGAKRFGHTDLVNFIRGHGYRDTQTITSVEPSAQNTVGGVMVDPTERAIRPPAPQRAISPELSLPSDLLAPAIMSIGFVAVMNPFLAKLRGVEPAQASQMLDIHWQRTYNEDSPLYIP